MKVWISILIVLLLASGVSIVLILLTDEEKEKNEVIDIIKETEPEFVPEEYNLSILFVGDALIHGSVYKDAYVGADNYDFEDMFEYIKPIVEEYDLAFYNQESIIGGKDLGLSSYPRFNSPDEIGDAMVNMGFNLVSLANNHTLDKGEKGILYSLDYWNNKDVMTAGSYSSIEKKEELNIQEKNNISYALLAYATGTNGLKVPEGKEYYVNIYNEEQVYEDIMRIRDKVDVLMVSMHWGSEYVHYPTVQELEIAEYLASLDVDIVIGHHPHVVQPIEFIDDTLVIYSLGNFISAQIGTERLTGMIVTLDVTKNIDKDETTMDIKNVEGSLIYTKYTNWREFKVYPYNLLNNSILPDYSQYYDKYSNIIRNMDETINVSDLGG